MPFKPCFLLIAVAVLLQGCLGKSPGSWKNGNIDPSKQQDFHAMNDRLFSDLKNDNEKDIEALECKEMLDNTGYTSRRIDAAANALQTTDYKLLDEYYVVNKYKDRDTIINHSKSVNNYNLIYRGVAEEMYMAFFVPKTGLNTYMLTIGYCHLSYGWKLCELTVSPYTINGKTGPELFEKAKEEHNKQHLINAAYNAELAASCFDPAEMWQYTDADDFVAFAKIIQDELQHTFSKPIVVSQAPTHPCIIGIYNKQYNDSYYPMVTYLTHIKLADTAALRKEKDHIKKALLTIFPGIDKGSDYLLFAAYNDPPSADKNVARFEMDDRMQ